MEVLLPKRDGKDIIAIVMKNANGDWVKYKPRIQSKWEYWAGGLARCPACGHEYTDYLECHNYCGNCGAEMEDDM